MASTIDETGKSHERTIVHTGQHYDPSLSRVFFEELDLPEPDLNLDVGSGSQSTQTGKAMIRLEQVFEKLRPDVVLVQGDTNTTLAAALAGRKLGIDIGHVEAGLRSHDLRMPEEHNRRLTDHLSSYLFAPTDRAAKNLQQESCWGSPVVTGNTVIDACLKYKDKAEKFSRIFESIPYDQFALATVHRAENVDSPVVLREFCTAFADCPLPVVLPLHPRTLMRLRESGLEVHLRASKNVKILPPVGYLDFLLLLSRCSFVLTDSGGIQEEATAPNIRKKVFVMREWTERPEAVEAGYCELVGTKHAYIAARIHEFLVSGISPSKPCPYGDGRAGARIANFVSSLQPMSNSKPESLAPLGVQNAP